jgi:hypothetical protein
MVDGKAQLNLEYNSCDLYLACTEACPTRALNAELPSLTGVYPAFNDNCVRSQGEDCALCVQAYYTAGCQMKAPAFSQS